MELNEEVFLIKRALFELSESIGRNQLNTTSISLLALELDISNEILEKVHLDLVKLSLEDEDLELNDFKEVIQKYISNVSDLTIIRIIDGFANTYIPKFKEYSISLKDDYITR